MKPLRAHVTAGYISKYVWKSHNQKVTPDVCPSCWEYFIFPPFFVIFLTGQQTHLTPLTSGFYVQCEYVQLGFAAGSPVSITVLLWCKPKQWTLSRHWWPLCCSLVFTGVSFGLKTSVWTWCLWCRTWLIKHLQETWRGSISYFSMFTCDYCMFIRLCKCCISPPAAGLMGMPGDSSQQARTACSYQHSPGAGSGGGGGSGSHHHQHNHGQASHHGHHPQQHLSPHAAHSQHQAHSQHGQHPQHPAHSQQHSSLSHQGHTGQTCPSTGENLKSPNRNVAPMAVLLGICPSPSMNTSKIVLFMNIGGPWVIYQCYRIQSVLM